MNGPSFGRRPGTATLNGAGLNGSPAPVGAGARRAGARPADRLPVVRRERRPVMAALAVLLIAGCAAVSANLALAGRGGVAVLVLARDVPAGGVLTAADLKVAQLAGGGVTALSAASEGEVVGQTLTAGLPAGTLLVGGVLSRSPVPAPGDQLVAAALKPGMLPPQAVPGRRVGLLRVEPPGSPAGAGGSAVLAPGARLLSVSADQGSALTLVSVEVSAGQVPAVAQAAAAGVLSITLLPAGATR